MNAIDATGPYRRPCGTNEIRPAVILRPSSPRPRSRAPRQSTPRTVADAPATLQEVALAIAACPAVPDPNVADPPSHHPPSRCCDNQLNPPNTSPSDTPSAWRRPASSPRWVASATRTTMLSPKPSTASTRPRSSIGVDHGAHARPSSSPRSNGSTGSTIAGCWNPSATSRRPKLRSATTPGWMSHPWPRDSNETASDQPGAVHTVRSTFRSLVESVTPRLLLLDWECANVFSQL